jgi:hypothetical protein
VIAQLAEAGSLVLLTPEAADLIETLNADDGQRAGAGDRYGE